MIASKTLLSKGRVWLVCQNCEAHMYLEPDNSLIQANIDNQLVGAIRNTNCESCQCQGDFAVFVFQLDQIDRDQGSSAASLSSIALN